MRIIACLALLAVIVPAAAAKTPRSAESLDLGTVNLSLGMQEGTAIGALKSQFHVERARSAGDDWVVLKDGNTVAIVSFSSDRLTRVSRTWMTTGLSSGDMLAQRLYTLASQLTAEGRTACTLAAKPYRVAGAEGHIVTIACGNISIQLTESRTPRSGWVTTLQEVLQ